MEDAGNLVLYVILAIIAIAGSLQNSKKKKAPGRSVPPGPSATRKPAPGTFGPAPKRFEPAPGRFDPPPETAQPVRQVQQQAEPRYVTPEPVNEGYYEDPVAASFAGEGSVSQNSAAAFADEGSVSQSIASLFADEGSIEDTMATAFATEGVSALNDLSGDEFSHIDITDSEITDAPEYDYESRETAEQLAERFSVREAVIFSAILQRKEYSF